MLQTSGSIGPVTRYACWLNRRHIKYMLIVNIWTNCIGNKWTKLINEQINWQTTMCGENILEITITNKRNTDKWWEWWMKWNQINILINYKTGFLCIFSLLPTTQRQTLKVTWKWSVSASGPKAELVRRFDISLGQNTHIRTS